MNCNKLCPINCQNNLCNIENGSCFGCKPGWRDTLCDKSTCNLKDKAKFDFLLYSNVVF